MDTIKKKLALVIPSLKVGGMERVMIELSHYLSLKPNLEVFLILLGENHKFFNLPINITVIEPKFNLNNKFYYTIQIFLYLRRTIKNVQPDALLSFGEMYNSFVLLSTLFLSTKIYVSDRSKPDKDWGVLHNLLRRIIYRRANGIISQTSYSKTFLKKEVGHSNIVTIPNPIRQTIHVNHLFKRKKVILTVGRLIKSKRIDILLDIFERSYINGWELWIVGDGPEMDNLKKIVSDKGLDSVVVFFGSQSNVYTFYNQASIFAFCSESEGFPNALLEAISFQLPCISFDCVAGPNDIIDHGDNGFLVKMYDLNQYGIYLNMLMHDENLRWAFGQKSLKKSKLFDISIVGEIYYKTLIQ